MTKMLVGFVMALTLVACGGSPRDKFNAALTEALAAAKTDEQRRTLEGVKRYSDNLTDGERNQFVESWNATKKANEALAAHRAKGP